MISTLKAYSPRTILKILDLGSICHNKRSINYDSIDAFAAENRSKNDDNNKLRESIIGAIINNLIPESYYTHSEKWRKIKSGIYIFIDQLCEKRNITFDTCVCVQKAGRNNHYDLDLTINGIEKVNVEFKYGVDRVNDAPQFVSPTKPSQFLNVNFDNWFYENHLSKIAEYGNLEMPDKDVYLKTINNNVVKCMTQYKEKYDTNKEFNKFCKKIDKLAIKEFNSFAMLDIEKMSTYLLKTQSMKDYMCYKNGSFYHDQINESLYNITAVVKREPTNFICDTVSGMKLEIKLRFKNGCGLQFPAFQIKRKIPGVKELRAICGENDITAPKLKKNICKTLDENNIIY